MEASKPIRSQFRKLPHFPVLDGWRGISILLVLFGHLVPLGPPRFGLNGSTAALGMAIFFTLSGFLITSTLLYQPSVRQFCIRRFFRIVPLAWLFTVISLLVVKAPRSYFPAELFFYANYPPFWLSSVTGHLWSLCVEMQFYTFIALLFLLFRRRGLQLLPFLCLAVTLGRVVSHTAITIETYRCLDEILAGAWLALLMEEGELSPFRIRLTELLGRSSPLLLFLLAFLCCQTIAGPLNNLRPYLAAWAVGSTLVRPGEIFSRILTQRWLVYMASISYALYILHPIAAHGWFESGTKLLRYEKRVPAMILVFGLAHLSTHYYEHFWIKLGKRWSARYRGGIPHSIKVTH